MGLVEGRMGLVEGISGSPRDESPYWSQQTRTRCEVGDAGSARKAVEKIWFCG